MRTDEPDDLEYPYAARSASTTFPDDAAVAAFVARRRFISLWFTRFAIAIALTVGLVLAGAGVAKFQAMAQAARVNEIELHGCSVTYLHQVPGQKDPLPEALRDWVGDHFWSQVHEVSHDPFFFGTGNDLTADDVKAICSTCRRFSKLRSFSINSHYFSCDQISDWPHLKGLEELQIGSARLSDADLKIIGTMVGLKSLKIASGAVSGEWISQLAQLPRLETVTFSKVTFNGTSPIVANAFGGLKSLTVDRSSDFGDDAIACFGSPPQLEDVNFHRSPIGDRGLAQLLQSGKVRSLIINEGQLTDASFAQVANYQAPGWLVLSGMPLTDSGLSALAGKEFPTLILDHTALTDQAFGALTNIKALEYVSLSHTKITAEGAGNLKCNPKLKHLDLSEIALTHKGILALAQVQCSELVLSRTSIGDRELMVLATNDNLIQLDVTGTAVTLDGVEAFFKARKVRLNSAGLPDKLTLIATLSGGDEFNPDRYTSTSVLSQPGMVQPKEN